MKLDAVLARADSTVKGGVRAVAATGSARTMLENLLGRYQAILVQEHVEGVGVGVFFLTWDGKVLATFMHRRLHEVPHTGGVSSYRRAWWNQRIHDDALARVRHVGWQSVCMMEYRWDPDTDAFPLMEMNFRF